MAEHACPVIVDGWCGQPRWGIATEDEKRALDKNFSPSARKRGVLPSKIMVLRAETGEILLSAMQYLEEGKWERWNIQRHPPEEITSSWSTILSWLRAVVGDKTMVEIFPIDAHIVNTAPVRWFWVMPDGVFTYCNLKV